MGQHQYSHLFSEETARRICLILDLTLLISPKSDEHQFSPYNITAL